MQYLRDLPFQYLDSCPIIDDKYKVLFKLGTGRFSKVKLGMNLATNQKVAIKIINQKQNQNQIHQNSSMSKKRKEQQQDIQAFLNQIKICLQCKNSHIIEILDFNIQGTYRTSDGKRKKVIYYVMKIAQYGQLYRLINQGQMISEKLAKYIFKQVLKGIKHLHRKGYAHCDVKAQNILIDQQLNIRIADFGCSRKIYNSSNHSKISYNSQKDYIGTQKCNAPELNQTNLDTYHADQVDMFALGCLLFELVMKSQPFKIADTKDEFFRKLISSEEKDKFWEIFASKCKPTSQFKDIVQKLLNPNPKIRMTLLQIFKHPWLMNQNKNDQKTYTQINQQHKKQLLQRLKKIFLKVRKQHQIQMKKIMSNLHNKLNAQSQHSRQNKQESYGKFQYQNFQTYNINSENKIIQEKINQINKLLQGNRNSSNSLQNGQDQSSNQQNSKENSQQDEPCPQNWKQQKKQIKQISKSKDINLTVKSISKQQQSKQNCSISSNMIIQLRKANSQNNNQKYS